MLVDDHDVGAQALEPPVLLRLQHLPHQRQVVVVADDADEQNRQIARDARAATGRIGRARSTAIASALARSEPSVPSTREARRSKSTASSAEMPRCRRPLSACVDRQREGARRRRSDRGISARALRRSRGRRPCRSRSRAAPCAPGAKPDPLAEADDRIEHDTRRPRQRAAVQRQRTRGVAAAAQEARAIGFPLDRALRAALRGSAHGTPSAPASPAIARPPMAQQRRRCRPDTRSRRRACRTPDARDR